MKLIKKLERIHRRTTKYILNLPFSTTVDYETRLQSLNLLPVSTRHEYLELILFFNVSPAIVVARRTTRSTLSKSRKYVIPKCRTTTYQKSYIVRARRVWNYLANELNITINTILKTPHTLKCVILKCDCVCSLLHATLCCC